MRSRQIGSFTQGKNKNVWNHHLVIVPNFGWSKCPTKGIIFLLFQWFLGLPGTREPPFVLKVVPEISRVKTAPVRLIILGKPLYFPPFTRIPWCPDNLGKKSIQNMTPLCRENFKIHYLKPNSLPLKIGWAPKGNFIFQPSIFRAYVSFRKGNIHNTLRETNSEGTWKWMIGIWSVPCETCEAKGLCPGANC